MKIALFVAIIAGFLTGCRTGSGLSVRDHYPSSPEPEPAGPMNDSSGSGANP